MPATTASLAARNCDAHPSALTAQQVAELLSALPGWELVGAACVRKAFRFTDYHRAMAFVNAVAWVAHRQDHHPDLTVGYNQVTVRYATHSVGGLSENDFICAAKVDALLDGAP